jgi:hypothetical protein
MGSKIVASPHFKYDCDPFFLLIALLQQVGLFSLLPLVGRSMDRIIGDAGTPDDSRPLGSAVFFYLAIHSNIGAFLFQNHRHGLVRIFYKSYRS